MNRRDRLTQQLGGAFDVIRLLGRGGMGAVWFGWDVKLECPVAIKILNEELSRDAEFVERFHRETKTLAKFQHSRIVRIKAAGALAQDGRLYMVMEFVAGKTLRTILDEHRDAGTVVDPVSAAFYAFQMVDGLGTAHAEGIIHRDVKPENMIVTPEGHLTLLDFGVAKVIERTGPRRDGTRTDGERGDRRETKKSTLLGTLRYLAPELIEHGRCDARSDLYAVGLLLVMMLTSEYPYDVDAGDDAAILDAHVHAPPILRREQNPDCPEALWGIALKLLAKDPAERYQDADEVGDDLSAVMRASVDPSHALAKKLEAERKERANRKAYEERGAPSTHPVASALPGAADQTVPVRAGTSVQSPCASGASAGAADVTEPIAANERPPSMRAPFPLARPRVDATRPMPAGRLPTGMPVWVAPPRVEVSPAPGETRWPRRSSRPTVVVLMIAAVLVTWVTSVMVVSSRRPPAVEGPAGAATMAVPMATATARTTATAEATPTATAATAATATAAPRATVSAPARRPGLPF